VEVDIGSTGAPHGPTSGGSRTTTSVGPAAAEAADQLARVIAARLGGRAVAAGVERADGVVSWAEALRAGSGERAVGRRPRDRRGYLVPLFFDHLHVGRGMSGAVHVTEVEVDTRLGRTRVRRVWAGIAAGRIWAPRLARSQAEGSIVQGIGFALYEQRRSDPVTGRVLTANLEDYRITGIADTPEMVVHFHEAGWDHVPGGGIGLGEVATVAVAASVGNAIHNATGWRPHDLPVRPDRMLAGLGA
jgi:xanthine dehydrogenase YagR molybdenum-binding subunit